MSGLNRAQKIATLYSGEIHVQRRSRIILEQVLTAATILPSPQPTAATTTSSTHLPRIKAKSLRGTQNDVTEASVAADPHTHIRPSEDFIYETPKREPGRHVGDDDDEFLDEDAKRFGRENVGSIARPYLMPYVYKKRFLEAQYGIRKDGDIFKFGYSDLVVDTDGDITIREKEFRWSEGLWELLTRKNVNRQHVTSDDLRTYKKILLLTNAHFE